MAEYQVLEVEKIKDVPDAKFGPAKVLKLSLKDAGGKVEVAEWFTKETTPEPKVGEKIEGEVSSSNYGPKFSKNRGGGGGGGNDMSPERQKKIQRQHSQEMALRRESNLIASGGRPFTGDELRSVINWFDSDVGGKLVGGTTIDGNTSDVPLDDADGKVP